MDPQMDPPSKSRLGFPMCLLTGLVAAGLAGVLWKQRLVSKLHDEKRTLSAVVLEAERLRKENNETDRAHADKDEMERLRQDNQELHKLRNEVRQLREQQKQSDALRVENQRLKTLAEKRPAPVQDRAPTAAAPLQARGAWIGVSISQFDPADNPDLGSTLKQGVVIQSVAENSPAANAGMQPGDIVVAVDNRPMDTPQQFRDEVAAKPAGQTMTLDIVRAGESLRMNVQAARRSP
jgi:C-terminal processing protease CtpA/Prc